MRLIAHQIQSRREKDEKLIEIRHIISFFGWQDDICCSSFVRLEGEPETGTMNSGPDRG